MPDLALQSNRSALHRALRGATVSTLEVAVGALLGALDDAVPALHLDRTRRGAAVGVRLVALVAVLGAFDDAVAAGGDGCSATCAIEMTCGVVVIALLARIEAAIATRGGVLVVRTARYEQAHRQQAPPFHTRRAPR